MRDLEHRVGTSLFERSHAGIRPTPAGERFLQGVSAGFEHLERAMRCIGELQRGAQGAISIASSVPVPLVCEVLERFRDAHKGVSVELMEGTCNEGVVHVQQRRADIAFVTKVPTGGTVESLHLRDDGLIAVLPKAHRLAHVRALLVEELQSEKFVFTAGGIGPELAEYLSAALGSTGRWAERAGASDWSE